MYYGAPVGLEVLVEFDHFFVFALPFRSNGEDQWPSDNLGSGGQRTQMHLQEALGLLRIPFDREAADLRSLGGNHSNCRAMVTILAGLVERVWSQVVARQEQLFPQKTEGPDPMN